MINLLSFGTYLKDGKVYPRCACLSLSGKESIFLHSEKANLVEDVLQFLVKASNSNHIDVYVHNLNFEGGVLIEYLTSSKSLFSIYSLGANLYWVDFYYLMKVVRFRCSYKLIPLSLRAIRGLESIDPTFTSSSKASPAPQYDLRVLPYENHERRGDLHTCEVCEAGMGCLSDIKALKKCLNNLFKVINRIDNRLLYSSYSAASLSHKLFFKYFNCKKIEKSIPKKDEAFVRRAYKGGRCEVFGNPRVGEVVKYFDFPGMYAQCMLEKFHNGRSEMTTTKDIGFPGFHNVTYQTCGGDFPILPSHSETGKLVFANGTSTGTFWFEELVYFIENGGRVLKKHFSLVYDKFEPVFQDYSEFFDETRRMGGYYKVFAKLMVNSLYGSMALRGEEYYNYVTFSESEFERILQDLNVHSFYKLNSVYILVILRDYKFRAMFKDGQIGSRSGRNVSYSAAITAKARVKLHMFAKEVIRDGGRILYLDTDSVYAAYPAADQRRIIGEVERMEMYEDAVFANAKTYALRKAGVEIIKVKGTGSDHALGFDEFKDSFYKEKNPANGGVLVSGSTLSGLSVKNGINFGKYDKRVFSDDKKTTKPLITENYQPPGIQ